MENKNIKVGAFETYEHPYNAIDRVSHGSERYYAGHCLIEYNNELYLADTLEEIINTDEGSFYSPSGSSKISCIGDITEELGLPWIDEGNIDVDYLYIDKVHKIDKDGQLLNNENEELNKKIRDLVSITVTTEEDIIEECNSFSKNTMPYGKINASLEISNGIVTLNMDDGRIFILSEEPKEKTLSEPLISQEKKKELLEILEKQQVKIENQEKELADLKEQRRILDEK